MLKQFSEHCFNFRVKIQALFTILDQIRKGFSGITNKKILGTPSRMLLHSYTLQSEIEELANCPVKDNWKVHRATQLDFPFASSRRNMPVLWHSATEQERSICLMEDSKVRYAT